MARPPLIQGKKNNTLTKKTNPQRESIKIFLQGFELHQKGLFNASERNLRKGAN